MIGVIAHLGREIESDGETCRTLRKQEMVALIRLFCCAEACILAHRPQARTIHSGMNAACERKFAWIAQLIMSVEILQVFFTGQVWHLNMRACDKLLLPLSCFFTVVGVLFFLVLRRGATPKK